MSGSAIAAGLDALIALYAAAAPTGFQVGDGRPFDPKRKFLAVGWIGDAQPSVEAARVRLDAAVARQQETFTVTNLLSVWSGKDLRPEVRAEAFDAFDAFDAALAGDRTLGRAVMVAQVTELNYMPARVAEGAMAQIRFAVTIRAVS